MKSYSRKQIPFKVMDGICYIIDSFETKSAFKLNEVSTSVWLFLESAKTEEEIMGHLLDEYDVEKEELQQDLQPLLQQMIADSLINEI